MAKYVISDALGNLAVLKGTAAVCNFFDGQWFPGVDLRIEKIRKDGTLKPLNVEQFVPWQHGPYSVDGPNVIWESIQPL
jgi:hypothetical protein